MKMLQDFTKKFPWLFGICMLVITWFVVECLPSTIFVYSELGNALKECLMAVVAIVIALLCVKNNPFKIEMKSVGWSVKTFLYFMIIQVGIMTVLFPLIMIIVALVSGSDVSIVYALLGSLLMAVSVGVYEELIFRHFLFGGLLGVMGKTRSGIVWAALISSFIFGFIHVASTLFGSDFSLVTIGQVAGKTFTTGMFGLVMCVVYIKTHNLWPIMFLHAFNDYLGVVASYFSNSGFVYAGVAGGQGLAFVITYGIMSLLFIPVLIKCIKILNSLELPQLGPMVSDSFEPCEPVFEKKKK